MCARRAAPAAVSRRRHTWVAAESCSSRIWCSIRWAAAGLPWVSAQRRVITLPPKSGWCSPCNRSPTAPCQAKPPGPPPTAAAPANERVTFTRTGDPDLAKIPDPAALPPRAASPPTALHGRYHETITYANGNSAPGQDDLTVRTVCLRTGDRCMSLFHATDGVVPLVFSGGKVDPRRRGHRAVQSRRHGAYQTHRRIPAARPAARSDSAAHRARPQCDDRKCLRWRRFRR